MDNFQKRVKNVNLHKSFYCSQREGDPSINWSGAHKGREIHAYMIKNTMEEEGIWQTMIINMYTNCRIMNCARRLYDQRQKNDVILQNVMTSTFVSCVRIDKSIHLFKWVTKINIASWNSIHMG